MPDIQTRSADDRKAREMVVADRWGQAPPAQLVEVSQWAADRTAHDADFHGMAGARAVKVLAPATAVAWRDVQGGLLARAIGDRSGRPASQAPGRHAVARHFRARGCLSAKCSASSSCCAANRAALRFSS